MILKFKAEDLISIVVKESKGIEEDVDVHYEQLNNLRNNLRKKGIVNDLGLKELKTVGYAYPKNIQIKKSCMTLKLSHSHEFVQHFLKRAEYYKKEDFNDIVSLWNMSKEK